MKEEIKESLTVDKEEGIVSREDNDELLKKLLGKVDNWMEKEELETLHNCLGNLGLCEKEGLAGEKMLFPVIEKKKKLSKKKTTSLVTRLYSVKKIDDLIHLNPQHKRETMANRSLHWDKTIN